MSGLSKTRTMLVSSAGPSSSDKQQAIHRQRGIPTRVHGNNDGKLDVNRNMQSSSSLTHFASSNLSSTNNNILQNSNFENESAQSGKIAMLKRGFCISIPVNSAKTLKRANSPKCSLKCGNQSRLACLLASSIENDVNKSDKKGKHSTSAVDASDKRRIESRSFANHCDSYDIPSKPGHSKLLIVNKNKNLNKILPSDEKSCKKWKDSNSYVKSSVSAKEISHETDTTIPQGVHGIRPAKESFNSKPSVISNSVKKPNLKLSCSDILSSNMTSHPRAFEKSNQRSGTKMPKSEMQANLSRQGSGPLTVSHQKTQSSASNKQSLLKNYLKKQSANRKSGENVSIESSVRLNEPRKISENSGNRASKFSEQSEQFSHVSNDQRAHSADRYQSLPTGEQGKSSRTSECHDIGINSNLSSERSDLLGQELILKTPVQCIPASQASSVPENRPVTMISVVSFHADKPVACGNSVASENEEESCQLQESHHEGKLLDDGIDLNGRVFHMPRRRHHCAAGSGEQLNTRSSCDSVVVADDSDSARLDFDIRRDKETRSVELGDVVLDAETFQQMIDELKTLKLTILRLQTMLLQICTGESGLHNNDIVDANGSVRVQHSPERHELRKRVNELEKLVWEQRKIIDGLKQTSVELETVSITPEIGAATSEAETELAFTFRENCCTTDNVNEPSLYVSCSSDVTSSVDIASSTREHFQLVNGGIEKQNMSTGHHFASSPVILSNDKHNIICNYQYPTNDNAVLGSSSGDALKSSCNSIDVQPEIKPGYGHKKSSSQRTFATKTEKNFVRQRTRSEEESTIDCSMFDYDGAVDSDHELNLGEPIECKHSSQMGNNSDFITRVLNSVIEQGTTGSEVACNQQRLGEHLENVTDFHSHLSDGSYGKFNLDQQGNIGLDFSMSENSIVSNTTRLITEAEEEVDSNNSRSLIQMLKSYSTAAAERKVKRLDNSVSASTPIREVCNSLPNTANTAQPKSASLHKATKQSREICTSRLPSSNASKLPAPIAK